MTDKLYRSSELARKYAENSYSHWEIERKYDNAVKVMKGMKPGARRLLLILHRLFEAREFRQVNRVLIAAALEHTKLHHHDLKLLQRLIDFQIIEVKRVGLKRGADGLPRGFEYRYSMDIDTAWLIHLARSKAKPVFLSTRELRAAAAAQPQPNKPQPNKSPVLALSADDPWYERLADRFLSLFGM